MKRFTLLAAAGLFSMSLSAQEAKEEPKEEGFVFTTVKELPITSIKNQNRAGTCWCYSSMAFLESELLRMGKGEYDLSEMYIKLILTVPMQQCALMEMYLSHKEVLSMM